MMPDKFIDSLAVKSSSKIVFLVMDGLGGLPLTPGGLTELESARTPHLDALVKDNTCGLLDPVAPGITPGSGPAHFALFGYDPLMNNVGRGLLSAAGLDFPMSEKDLFIRANFATINSAGMVTDRRAGRIDSDTNRRLCRKLKDNIHLPPGIKVFFETEKEHRALIVLRGEDLHEQISETDPQRTGVSPLPPEAMVPAAAHTAGILTQLIEQVREILADESKANMVLLRGFAKYRLFTGMEERYKLRPLAIASYPMYRGISRLLGMAIYPETLTMEDEIAALEASFSSYDFFFVHIKPTDSRGEDGNFPEKVKVIEAVDRLITRITALKPDVLVVTGDHSTPSAIGAHSWHPVPVLLAAKTCRPDLSEHFGERDCLRGGLGRLPMTNLMPLALAHAGRLEKFGA